MLLENQYCQTLTLMMGTMVYQRRKPEAIA